MHTVRLAAVSVCSFLLTGAEARAADWPGFLGPNRDGCSTETGLLKQWPQEGPALKWKNEAVGPGWSSVAVASGCVYTTGNEGDNQMLICLDAATGKEKWRGAQGPKASNDGYSGARSTPTVDGDRVYVTGGDGLFTCHQTATGKILWKHNMLRELGGKVGDWIYAESPLIFGRLAIVTPGGPHALAAFDKTTGAPAWKSDISATAGYSSCVTITQHGNTVIANGTQSGLLFVDAKTGKEIYRNPFADGNVANTPTPAYSDGYLFWAVGYNKGGICLKIGQTGGKWTFDEAWTTRDFNCHPGNYVVAKGRVYGKGRGGLICADLKTGKVLWQERGGAGQVCWADGMLYSLADSGGALTLLDAAAESNRVKGSIKLAGEGNSWSHPAIANGCLYVRYDTNLYCFDIRAK